jgi:diguanylate cyclase (GGDEF)-like protein
VVSLLPGLAVYLWISADGQTLIYTGTGAACVAGIVVSSFHYRPRHLAPWMLIAGAFALLFLGDLVYAAESAALGGEPPFPSWADLPHLLYYPLLIVALARMLGKRRQRDRAAWLDAALWTSGIVIVLWEPLIEPNIDSTYGLFSMSVTLAYPVMDMVVLLMVLRLVAGEAGGTVSFRLLAVGLLAHTGTDVGHLIQHNGGTYLSDSAIDLGRLITYVIIAAAAVHPSMARVTAPSTHPPRLASHWRWSLLLLPAMAIPASVGYQVWVGNVNGEVDDLVMVALVAVVVIAGMMLRGSELLAVAHRRTDQLWRQVNHDALTGLVSRHRFVGLLDQALDNSRGQGMTVSVAFLDLDDFKTVNDSLGHEAGDRLLVVVAERLTATIPAGDVLARFGGDEFAVLIRGGDAGAVAQSMLAALEAPVLVHGRQLQTGASIGLATATEPDWTTAQMLQAADVAMYTAKRAGTGCAQYKPDMAAQLLARIEVRERLTTALRDKAIQPWFQPVISLQTGHLLGFEALARWCKPGSPPAPPDSWLPLAEETGLITDVDRQILRAAITQFQIWKREFQLRDSVHLAVNMSGNTLHQPGIAEDVIQALAEAAMPASLLVVEVTEGVLLDDNQVSVRLQRLRAAGIRIALDDFGTGWSSLDYLRRYPVDQLKLDRSFTNELGTSSSAHAIPAAVIQLATAMSLDVVAEGVETRHQQQRLIQLGFDAAQGYLFSPPLCATDIQALLQQRQTIERSLVS